MAGGAEFLLYRGFGKAREGIEAVETGAFYHLRVDDAGVVALVGSEFGVITGSATFDAIQNNVGLQDAIAIAKIVPVVLFIVEAAVGFPCARGVGRPELHVVVGGKKFLGKGETESGNTRILFQTGTKFFKHENEYYNRRAVNNPIIIDATGQVL